MEIKELIATHLNTSSASIVKVTDLYKVWSVVVAGCRARFVSKLQVLGAVVKQSMKVQVCTGSEYHASNKLGAMVLVNGQPIYQVLKATTQEWELVGNKGNHGKWCIAEYELPAGAKVEFRATATRKDPIEFSFVVGDVNSVDVDGYNYGARGCGWIVSI